MALGFMLNAPPHRPMGLNPEAFANPVAGRSLCRTTNNRHVGGDIGSRAVAIIEAACASIA